MHIAQGRGQGQVFGHEHDDATDKFWNTELEQGNITSNTQYVEADDFHRFQKYLLIAFFYSDPFLLNFTGACNCKRSRILFF